VHDEGRAAIRGCGPVQDGWSHGIPDRALHHHTHFIEHEKHITFQEEVSGGSHGGRDRAGGVYGFVPASPLNFE
jgi:hypothetical protein